MTEPRLLPPWADDLRRRYLRGEAPRCSSSTATSTTSSCTTASCSALTDFLADVLLKDIEGHDRHLQRGDRRPLREAAIRRGRPRRAAPRRRGGQGRSPALERLLVRQRREPAVILEYAETHRAGGRPVVPGRRRPRRDRHAAPLVVPARDREAATTSSSLVAENLTELSPKLVSNPQVAVVDVPMPDRDDAARRRAHRRPALSPRGRSTATPRSPRGSRRSRSRRSSTPPPPRRGRRGRARGVHRRASSADGGRRRRAREEARRPDRRASSSEEIRKLIAPGRPGRRSRTTPTRPSAPAARPTA